MSIYSYELLSSVSISWVLHVEIVMNLFIMNSILKVAKFHVSNTANVGNNEYWSVITLRGHYITTLSALLTKMLFLWHYINYNYAVVISNEIFGNEEYIVVVVLFLQYCGIIIIETDDNCNVQFSLCYYSRLFYLLYLLSYCYWFF